MVPTLPHRDPYPSLRASRLAAQRDRYRYRYDYPAGVPMAEAVPRGDGFSPAILLEVGKVKAAVAANQAAVLVNGLRRKADGPLSAHRRLFATIPAPPIVERWCGDARTQDLVFAWQRIAGANPMSLRRLDALHDGVRLSDGDFARAIAPDATDSPAAALAEGRLHVVDHSALAGTRGGRGFGARKHLPAPIGLFLQHRGGELLPLAIAAAPGDPVATPADGHRWRLARAAFQIADANWHELALHLGLTHFVAEAFVLATRRRLDVQHPVRVLLEPHFESTLAINQMARTALLVPGGEVEALLAPDLEGSLAIIAGARSRFSLTAALPPEDLRARGVAAAEGLPIYPYRDDGLLVWGAIAAFVRGYLGVYYQTAADLGADLELRAWRDELSAADGGRLGGVPELATVDGLGDVIAYVLWLASAQHAAINYPQFEAMAFTPSTPLAAYGPTAGLAEAGEEALARALGPLDAARAQLGFFYQQSQIRANTLGITPGGHFRDERVSGPVRRFRERLLAVEAEIAAREPGRLLPYPWLRPSRIPASIHI